MQNTDDRTLTIQSVLFENASRDIVRSAEAIAGSATQARNDGVLGSWTFAVGDCSETPVLAANIEEDIRDLVEASGGDFLYLPFGANLGHGGGHNQLAEATSSNALLFLNPDSLVAPDTLTTLLAALRPGIGVVDGRQLPLEHAKDYDQSTGDTSWGSGACLMTTRAAFDEVHGFDHETFFLYCDDVDYSWRVKLAGLRVVHEPAARVFHDKRLTIDGDIIAGSAELYYSAEAALMLAHKYSRPEIVRAILDAFAKQSDEPLSRAAREFESRRGKGLLPKPLDAEHTAGQFVAGNYAIHRY